MTDPNPGSKRPYPGRHDSEHTKRPRSDPRDWKDVHLASSSHRRKPSPTSDRRSSHRSARDYSRDRPRSRSRDRRDRRDGRDKERDRERDRRHNGRDRERERDHDSHSSRAGSERRRTPTSPRAHVNGASRRPDHDSDKEEGEISPPPRSEIKPAPSETPAAPAPAPPPEPELELELATSPVPVELTLAQRRAKRQEIMAKYTGAASVTPAAASPSPSLSSAVLPPQTPSVASNLASQLPSTNGAGTPLSATAPRNPEADGRGSPSASPTGDMFELAKDNEQEGAQVEAQEQAQREGDQMISAADYDPSLDRREDEERRVRGGPPGADQDVEMVEEVVEEEEDDDDLDDMFAMDIAEKKPKKVKKVVTRPNVPALITTTLDSASDHEGYYSIILGEQLDGGRYQVFASLGKGMFANVVRARVLTGDEGEAGKEVAIKIVRSQESMYKAGQKEIQILNKLKQADPEDKKHVVRLERSFEHRGHLCLVFESLSMNLREVVKKFGKDVGLNIRAVRAYAQQLFLAMSLLRKCNIMHADIKPDNILVNEQKTLLKLCDLGSASDAAENDITPYLVSRFYRAPEIIMGYPYDFSLDIWSIGCTLYELYTGKILFAGRSNNQMLLLMMELKGRFNSKMIKKAKFGSNYFDDMGGFESVEMDRVTGGDTVRKVHIAKPSRDMRARLVTASSAQLKEDERKMLLSFVDLLDKCLALDPARRITPKEALAHPFIRG